MLLEPILSNPTGIITGEVNDDGQAIDASGNILTSGGPTNFIYYHNWQKNQTM